jgi:hypothetical protein
MRDERLPGVADDAIRFIRSRHRYVGGKATNLTLVRLARLSNDDKHRAIHPVVSAVVKAQGQIVFTRCEPIAITGPASPPELKPDTVLTRLHCRTTGDDPKVGMQFQPTIYICLDDGTSILDLLDEFKAEARTVLSAPQILSALN